jgi:hypothetical protein
MKGVHPLFNDFNEKKGRKTKEIYKGKNVEVELIDVALLPSGELVIREIITELKEEVEK